MTWAPARLPEHADARARLHEALFRWARQPRQRVTIADDLIEATEIQARVAEAGILIGYADEADLAAQRQRFKPRYASTNPLVKITLDKLTGRHEDVATTANTTHTPHQVKTP